MLPLSSVDRGHQDSRVVYRTGSGSCEIDAAATRHGIADLTEVMRAQRRPSAPITRAPLRASRPFARSRDTVTAGEEQLDIFL